MAGGLIQLVAKGIQDIYLTSEPKITYFKIVYRRHTNFSIESIPQNFSSTVDFGETASCTISRLGDLIGRIFLYVEVPIIPKFIDPLTQLEDPIKKIAWVNNLGYAIIKEIFIEIGGKIIDKQYGEWMYIWAEVANKKNDVLDKMIGNIPKIYEFSNGKSGYQLFIPLEFWFCRNSGLYLPLVALASSNVKLTVTFRRLEECYRIGPTHSIEIMDDIVLFEPGDYIQQTINGQTIYGYVINYDYLKKKLYYIKINSPCAYKTKFEAYFDHLNYLPKKSNYDSDIDNNSEIEDDSYTDNGNDDFDISGDNGTENLEFIPYRIYNSIKKNYYCTPMPNTLEMVEQISFPAINQLKLANSFFYVDYVYLDTDERSKFIRSNHEYLIEQIQFNEMIGIKSPNIKQKLLLNHPCKAFYWVAQLDSLVGPGTINDLFNYTSSHVNVSAPIYSDSDTDDSTINDSDRSMEGTKADNFYGKNMVENAVLILNGQKRFSERGSEYFNLVEPFEHHSRGPKIGINVYSPSINPEDHQPSSTINMSKIDDACFKMRLNNVVNPTNSVKLRTYTINYNILRIVFQMGGLAF